MTKWFLLCGTLLVCSAGAAQFKLDTLKIGTTTYSNVTVLGANTTDLYFSHANGFANVKLKYVGPELQKRFDYNAKAAEEAEKRQVENEILYQTALAHTGSPRPGNAATPAKPLIGSETGLADPISDKSLLGKPGPTVQVDKWLGDKPALEGKFVLINFWATWSAPSRQYIPELNALQKKYSEKLVVVGISADPENEVADMTDPRIEYASGLDSKAKLTAAAGVTSIPCVLLVDPKGIVLYQGHPAALTERRLQAILARPTEE
ncbi:MAG TPA: TlpA disulfide reductase family protein [Verrucomicrobiae bacterium]|nr:TlpA disulfide reductase family protein [Verrucomicrobiae bacterium]